MFLNINQYSTGFVKNKLVSCTFYFAVFRLLNTNLSGTSGVFFNGVGFPTGWLQGLPYTFHYYKLLIIKAFILKH
ncbi:hypothetical protein BKI52_37250 [marine bacterium AO1-C]|nr:hypothetical protein BKI52_37250 [marine bacterium AO1-C]